MPIWAIKKNRKFQYMAYELKPRIALYNGLCYDNKNALRGLFHGKCKNY